MAMSPLTCMLLTLDMSGRVSTEYIDIQQGRIINSYTACNLTGIYNLAPIHVRVEISGMIKSASDLIYLVSESSDKTANSLPYALITCWLFI